MVNTEHKTRPTYQLHNVIIWIDPLNFGGRLYFVVSVNRILKEREANAVKVTFHFPWQPLNSNLKKRVCLALQVFRCSRRTSLSR